MRVFVRQARLAPLVNSFENRLYGPDFETSLEDVEHWLSSDMFFWSVCSSGAEPTTFDEILGVLTILVTSEAQARELVWGKVKESQLRPWVSGQRERPVLYFSSYSASVAGAGRYQFQSASTYFDDLWSGRTADPLSALSIAASDAGAKHLTRAGYRGLDFRYLSKYQIFQARCSDQPNRFWTSLLRYNLASVGG